MGNPLVSDPKSIRWAEIRPEHILPALRHQFEVFKERFRALVESDAAPTFENTVLAVDFAAEELDRTVNVYSVLDGNHNTEGLQAIQKEVNGILSEYSNLIFTNKALSKRVETVFAGLAPGTEEYEITRGLRDAFAENGIRLPKPDQMRLQKIEERLSDLGDLFDQNLRIRRNAVKVKIRDLSLLKGIPESSIESVKATLDADGNYWIALNRPNLITQIMEKAESTALRRKIYFAGAAKDVAGRYITEEEAGDAWKVDNRPVLLEIVNLRQELARIHGRTRYADRVLRDRMAKDVERVERFYRELFPAVQRAAAKEKSALLEFARSHDPSLASIEPWDQSFWVTRMYEQKFRLDDEKISEYFEVNRTIRSVFDFYSGLFDIRFEKVPSARSYLPDVEVYRIYDSRTGMLLSELHLDLYTRETKSPGAWKASIQKAGLTPRGRQTSIMGITLNLERGAGEKPVLLRIDDVNTLFHELGHGMHEALTTVKYQSLAGTSVVRDFVEFPSQIMENWLYTPEFLGTGAVHFQTGKPIPQDWIQRIRDAQNFRAGTALRRQMTLGILDLKWHTLDSSLPVSFPGYVDLFEKGIYLEYSIPYLNEFSPFSPGFGHIFSGGYAMGYYSYLWGNMIEADGFEYWYSDKSKIKEKALKLRELILSRGGSMDANELYRAWTGRDYNPRAFLRRSGL